MIKSSFYYNGRSAGIYQNIDATFGIKTTFSEEKLLKEISDSPSIQPVLNKLVVESIERIARAKSF